MSESSERPRGATGPTGATGTATGPTGATAPPAPVGIQPPAGAVTAVPWEVYRTQSALNAANEARSLEMDQAEPGGRYIVNADTGEVVDANGEPIKKANEPSAEKQDQKA